MAYCDISMAVQWAPGTLYPKGKIRVSLPNKGYLLLMFIQWVWAIMDITHHKHSEATKKGIFHFGKVEDW